MIHPNYLLITNNKLVAKKYEREYIIELVDFGIKEVIFKARDYIHLGYKLLTHPLSGSVKPNENRIKSVLLEKGDKLDYESLSIIEGAVQAISKFESLDSLSNNEEDEMLIDLTLIGSALD